MFPLLPTGAGRTHETKTLFSESAVELSSVTRRTVLMVPIFREPDAFNARSSNKMLQAVRHALTRVGEFTTHPAAFAVVAAYAVAWLIFSPETFGWAAIAYKPGKRSVI
jgi:hypothetical protein